MTSTKPSGITRRRFIESTGILLGGMLAAPLPAMAKVGGEEDIIEIEGSTEAREKWQRALEKAAAEGAAVYSGSDCEQASTPAPHATVKAVSASKQVMIGAIYDTVIISANYGVNGQRITPFNWAKIVCSGGSVSESNYNYSIIDYGRTAAVRYHAVVKAVGGWPTYVGDFYAEFFYTFTGRIS